MTAKETTPVRIKLAILSTLFLAAAGCETRVGDFTAISSRTLTAKNVDINKLPRKEGCEGKKMWWFGMGANLKEPLELALKSGGGNLMIDAAVYYEDDFFLTGFRVRGTVVQIPDANSTQSQSSNLTGTQQARANER
jgi:hypothetical protein